MDKTYTRTVQETLEKLGVTAQGLSAAQAQERIAQYGPNKLKDAEKPTLLERFLNQLKDPMLMILMAAAAVSAVTNIIAGESLAEVLIILIVVLLNAVLGVVQESKAEAAIEALQTMTAATCKVLRDGKQVQLHSDELVPGDVVLLEAGDSVPADGRLLESASLKIEEAALTGESVPVNKIIDALELGGADDIPLGDRKNMCYMGSTVVYGRGKAVITKTGMETEMGKIAGALAATEEEQTPLVNFAAKLGLKKNELETETPRVDEAPFDSSRKMMSTVHALKTGYVQYTKGAPDEVLKRCAFYEQDGAVLPMTEEKRRQILTANKAMADKALRVLMAARRDWAQKPEENTPEYLECELIYLGLAMIGSLLLTTLVLEVPALANAFGFTPVGLTEYILAIVLALLVVPVVEGVKWIQRKTTK